MEERDRLSHASVAVHETHELRRVTITGDVVGREQRFDPTELALAQLDTRGVGILFSRYFTRLVPGMGAM